MFIDLEKTYDRIPREVLLDMLGEDVPFDYIRVIYKRMKTKMRMLRGEKEDFLIVIGLHASMIDFKLFSFTIVMDKFKK